jgi:hypothetical protein
MKKIYSFTVYSMLYQQLIKRFGPFEEWTGPGGRLPGRDLDKSFLEFCDDAAKFVGANSGEALRKQLEFAMPIRPGHKQRWGVSPKGRTPGLARVAILNIAAALETGFITNGMLPSIEATGPPAPNSRTKKAVK